MSTKPRNRLPATNGQPAEPTAEQPERTLSLTLHEAGAIVQSLEVICRGGIASACTEHVTLIRQILARADQASQAAEQKATAEQTT